MTPRNHFIREQTSSQGYAPCASTNESTFRNEVREALDMDWSTHSYQMIAEIKRLKQIEREGIEALSRLSRYANGEDVPEYRRR